MPGDSEIKPLDEDTIARIAAGEVVDRPASAVKELVENSLDAGASSVDVTIEAGGTELIRVTDDGHGMTEADCRAAVRKHTTSKIGDLADLESGVGTLGFRGEALHAIAAVSRLTIESRPHEGDVGTRLEAVGGEIETVEPAGCPVGTTVTVTDLFFNTPARRKFLKSTATEFGHVNRIVTRYALANPDLSVSLTHDDREVFATTGQGDLEAAILSVYGREVAESMVTVEANGDELPAGPIDEIRGRVSHPETTRSSREYLSTFVNGRAIRSSPVRDGIMTAYGRQLGADRYPFVVLFLSVDGEAVDVNVHPRKREVRFDDEAGVRQQVRDAVENALLEEGLVRSSAPRGRSAPDEATVEHETAAGEIDEPTAEYDEEDSVTRDGSTRVESGGTGDEVANETDVVSSTSVGTQATESEPSATSEERPLSTEASTDAESEQPTSSRVSESGHERTTGSGTDRERSGRRQAGAQRTLVGAPVETEPSFDSLPSLRLLGQLGDTYVVCEADDSLVLIDQHAADERVNYERLQDALAETPASQALATSVSLELTASESAAFDTLADSLDQLGFRAERSGERAVEVTAVPAVLDETVDPERLRDVLTELLGDHTATETPVEELATEVLADLACYPSITGNTSLTEGSILELLETLDECRNPYACPHGRPVIIEIDEDEIDERFERDYPGHPG